jgi:hypothetical protein
MPDCGAVARIGIPSAKARFDAVTIVAVLCSAGGNKILRHTTFRGSAIP